MNFKISSPTLLLDKQKVLNNIQKMLLKVEKNGLKFRPHFKTHQSVQIGRWFDRTQLDGITVSSLKMAEFFSKDGWQSITVAFPMNILEIDRVNNLASSIDLRTLIVDVNTVNKLDAKLTTVVGVYIEIDPGYGRSGIHFDDKTSIESLKEAIQSSKKLELHGFYCHAGHSYQSRSIEEIRALAKPIIEQLSNLKVAFDLPVCFGDTPSCSVLEDFGEIEELSPGNFVFYDWIQTQIGSCTPDQIAVAMACPVVAKYESRNELLIHGGAVHFSKDFDLHQGSSHYFGQVAENNDGIWGDPMKDCYLKSISQEHGIIKCTDEFFQHTKISDSVIILPIHSCLTADLMGQYFTTDGVTIDHLSEKMIK